MTHAEFVRTAFHAGMTVRVSGMHIVPLMGVDFEEEEFAIDNDSKTDLTWISRNFCTIVDSRKDSPHA
jgi:hypothetical protein